MRISDWSSDVCSSDLSSLPSPSLSIPALFEAIVRSLTPEAWIASIRRSGTPHSPNPPAHTIIPSNSTPSSAALASGRSEEHTSELQSLMRISYAVFCLKNKKKTHNHHDKRDDHHRIQHTTQQIT